MTQKASTQGLIKAVENQQTAQTGVDPYRKAQSYLRAMMPAITEALPKTSALSAERLSRLCLTTLRTNPKLLECSIESLLGACLQSASLGLDPSLLGSCYFIPFKGQVSFQIGYKGLLDLLNRSGTIKNIVAQEVRTGDKFHFEYGRNETLEHIPAPISSRGEVYAYYAYAHLENGGFAFQVLSMEEILKIRDDYSMAYRYDKNNSIWAKHFDEMAKKTVIKRLVKYLPISVETSSAIQFDGTTRKDISAEAIFPDEEVKVEILDKQEEKQ